jgi:hypothetical protein
MKELLIAAGYTRSTRCSCSGTYTEKWIKGAQRFDIRPNRKTEQWIYRLSGKIIKSGLANELQEYLQEIG